MAVLTHEAVPETVIGEKYPVDPPTVAGSETYGANADGAYRAARALLPISLHPRGESSVRL